ncbi:NRT1/ PTR family 6.2 [Hibiscus trionum]|uniref:NRT1/ PTR family 6.2 n=1 Tax=Hibiscus trionum TaxID=183268 RepID=A0A9W7MBJ9_HIBTR|nr:NRT1/ PTR family 6.2 [Hibiscus trionum]
MEENQTQIVSDAVDYKGIPADRTTSGGWVAATLILGVELSERLSTTAIAVNLATYLIGTMHLPSATSANIVTNFGGTAYMLSLLGGILADTFLTRYRTIAIFAVVNALGTCLLVVSTWLPQLRPPPCNPARPNECVEANSLQMGVFTFSLYLYGIGLSGIKSSVPGFGTDQFDKNDEKEKLQMASFFNVFYLITNIGTLLAVTVLVYVEDKVGPSWGYGICSAFMLLSTFVFLSGTKKYRYKETPGSPVVQILQVLVAAIRKRKVEFPSDLSHLYEDPSQELRLSHTNRLRCLDKATIITSKDAGTREFLAPNPWSLCSVTRVEEVKMLTGLLPICATTILFSTVYAQMGSFSVQQALTMERSIGNFEIPPASYNAFMIGSILLTLAIYDHLIMPLFRKTRYPQGLTSLQKIGFGLFFSIIAMVGAALAEMKRLSVVKTNRSTTLNLTVTVSGFLLVPQFILVGIGNAFIYAGQLEFFITESPRGMKGIGTGLFLTTISLGFFGSTILVEIVRKVTRMNGGRDWLAHRINDGRLDLFYGLLAVLSFINLGLFLLCAKMYKPNPEQKLAIVDVPIREETA